MDNLFICNTPYQVLNAINIIENKIQNCTSDNTDILIETLFNSAETLGARLAEFNVCRDVFYATRNGRTKKIVKIFNIITNNYPVNLFSFTNNQVLQRNYNSIWVGDDSPLGLVIFTRNKNTKVYWYDDGTSTYSWPPTKPFGKENLYSSLAPFFRWGCYRYNSKTIYLNTPQMVQYQGYDFIQLPEYSNDNPAIKKDNLAFNYLEDRSFIRQYKTVVLTQILPSTAEYKGIDIESLFDEETERSQIIVRKHPRDTKEYLGCIVDNGQNMWEIECLNNISDQHILIACCSTAQMTPKMLAGKEPYVFFLYRFLLGEKSTAKKNFDGLVHSLKSVYSDDTKVIIPESLDEFKKEYQRLVKKGERK